MNEPQGRGFSLTHWKQGGITSDLPRWGKTGLLLFPSKPLRVLDLPEGSKSHLLFTRQINFRSAM